MVIGWDLISLLISSNKIIKMVKVGRLVVSWGSVVPKKWFPMV
jgi:hypothetical protein